MKGKGKAQIQSVRHNNMVAWHFEPWVTQLPDKASLRPQLSGSCEVTQR